MLAIFACVWGLFRACDPTTCCCPGDPTGEACCGAGLACAGSGLGACGCGAKPPAPCVADFGAKVGDKRKCGHGVVKFTNQTCNDVNAYCHCDIHSPCFAPEGTGSCLSSAEQSIPFTPPIDGLVLAPTAAAKRLAKAVAKARARDAELRQHGEHTDDDNCTSTTSIHAGYDLVAAHDTTHALAADAGECAARCCADARCRAFTFSSSQPKGPPSSACPAGSKCCWLKGATGKLVAKANCTSGQRSITPTPPPPPTPPTPPTPRPTPPPTPPPTPQSDFLTPSLAFVSTIANDSTGNLRDPSAVVQDPATGLWHFYVDYMPGRTGPGWHAHLHHYSAPDFVRGPWTSHGVAPGLNHSSDPVAWDYAGTFSPSLIYDPACDGDGDGDGDGDFNGNGEGGGSDGNDDVRGSPPKPSCWFLFYSASGANQSRLSTCAQMVARAPTPDGPWEKLGLVGAPVGSDDGNWSKAWNAQRLDSGRALIIGGVRAYWTKGCEDRRPYGGGASFATEGVYFPDGDSSPGAPGARSFAPPYHEYASNPVYRGGKDGYENCEFFMGPRGEASRSMPGNTGVLHVMCEWHTGGYAHFVADPHGPRGPGERLSAMNWTYVGNVRRTDGAGEPTPVYEPKTARAETKMRKTRPSTASAASGGGGAGAGADAGADAGAHAGTGTGASAGANARTRARGVAVGIPGDEASVRYFIARQSRGGGLTIGLYKLSWEQDGASS